MKEVFSRDSLRAPASMVSRAQPDGLLLVDPTALQEESSKGTVRPPAQGLTLATTIHSGKRKEAGLSCGMAVVSVTWSQT